MASIPSDGEKDRVFELFALVIEVGTPVSYLALELDKRPALDLSMKRLVQ